MFTEDITNFVNVDPCQDGHFEIMLCVFSEEDTKENFGTHVLAFCVRTSGVCVHRNNLSQRVITALSSLSRRLALFKSLECLK